MHSWNMKLLDFGDNVPKDYDEGKDCWASLSESDEDLENDDANE